MFLLAVGGKVNVNSVLRRKNLLIQLYILEFSFDYIVKVYGNTWTISYLKINYPKLFECKRESWATNETKMKTQRREKKVALRVFCKGLKGWSFQRLWGQKIVVNVDKIVM